MHASHKYQTSEIVEVRPANIYIYFLMVIDPSSRTRMRHGVPTGRSARFPMGNSNDQLRLRVPAALRQGQVLDLRTYARVLRRYRSDHRSTDDALQLGENMRHHIVEVTVD